MAMLLTLKCSTDSWTRRLKKLPILREVLRDVEVWLVLFGIDSTGCSNAFEKTLTRHESTWACTKVSVHKKQLYYIHFYFLLGAYWTQTGITRSKMKQFATSISLEDIGFSVYFTIFRCQTQGLEEKEKKREPHQRQRIWSWSSNSSHSKLLSRSWLNQLLWASAISRVGTSPKLFWKTLRRILLDAWKKFWSCGPVPECHGGIDCRICDCCCSRTLQKRRADLGTGKHWIPSSGTKGFRTTFNPRDHQSPWRRSLLKKWENIWDTSSLEKRSSQPQIDACAASNCSEIRNYEKFLWNWNDLTLNYGQDVLDDLLINGL